MSVQTWFLMIELPLASALLILVAKRKRADRDQWTSYWYVLALGFAILSVDKIAGFHELLNSKISMSWVIPAGIVVAIFIAVYIRFLFYLPLRTRSLFINSGAEFVGGALGVERAIYGHADQKPLNTLAYNLWTAVEEGMEMCGVRLFIYALLGSMGGARGFRIEFDFAVK